MDGPHKAPIVEARDDRAIAYRDRGALGGRYGGAPDIDQRFPLGASTTVHARAMLTMGPVLLAAEPIDGAVRAVRTPGRALVATDLLAVDFGTSTLAVGDLDGFAR